MRLYRSLTIVVLLTLALLPCMWALQAEKEQEAQTAPGGVLAPPETLSGTILMVEEARNLLIVQSARGVPYNFVVTRATRITADGQRLKLSDLAARKGSQVTVRFVPTRRGNIARTVEVSG